MTPVSTAAYSLSRLHAMLSGLRNAPSEKLEQMLRLVLVLSAFQELVVDHFLISYLKFSVSVLQLPFHTFTLITQFSLIRQ